MFYHQLAISKKFVRSSSSILGPVLSYIWTNDPEFESPCFLQNFERLPAGLVYKAPGAVHNND